MLEVRRLRLLAEFATHGTVAATAEALHLTGPAVSQQLAALEKETGLTLLEKHGRALRLTGAGRLLVEHAQVVLADLAAAQADVAALRQGRPGAVRVAAFPSAARVLLPLVWPEPGADAPRLHLVEHEPDAADEALRQRTVDVAVTHAYSLLPGRCRRAASSVISSTNRWSWRCIPIRRSGTVSRRATRRTSPRSRRRRGWCPAPTPPATR